MGWGRGVDIMVIDRVGSVEKCCIVIGIVRVIVY